MGVRVLALAWRDAMSVGIKAIDDDHQQLISLINQFSDIVHSSPDLGGKAESAVRSILGRLQSYTVEHFQREERLQAEAGYDGLAENRAHHLALTKTLNSMIERFTGGAHAAKPLSAKELSAFLNSWLVDHIIKVDLKMKSHDFKGVW